MTINRFVLLYANILLLHFFFHYSTNSSHLNPSVTATKYVLDSINTADEEQNSFAYLPNEIWILVMSFLDVRSLATVMALANRRFNALVSYEPLWERIYHSYFLPWRDHLELLFYERMNSLVTNENEELFCSSPVRSVKRHGDMSIITWRHVVTMRYMVEKRFLYRVLLERNIMQEYARLASESTENKARDMIMVEMMSDHGDNLLKAARTAEEKGKNGEENVNLHLWLRIFCIEIYEACLTLIPLEWHVDSDKIPYIPTTNIAHAQELPKDLNQYTEKYPPFWRSIHNLAIAIMDLHGFVIRNNDEQRATYDKIKLLIYNLVQRFENSTLFEQCFPSPIANWARLFLDCGSDMMEEDPKLSQELLEKSICLFSKELSITNARQLNIEFDSCYCYADAMVRLAAVKPLELTEKYFVEMEELLEKSYQAFRKCVELKPTDFITIYRTGLVVIRRINLTVLMADQNHTRQLIQRRKEFVQEACQYFSRCVQVQDYYRAHEMWGMVLFDEAERLNHEWLAMMKLHDGHFILVPLAQIAAEELYNTLQEAINQFMHAKKAMTHTFQQSSKVHLAHYCEEDIACAMSRQFEIRLRQWQHAKREESDLINSIDHKKITERTNSIDHKKITERTNSIDHKKITKRINSIDHKKITELKQKLKLQQVIVKQLEKNVCRLHYKAMMEFEALREYRKGFSLFHIARIKCLMGDENQTKRNLFKLFGTDNLDMEIGSRGQVILSDSAFLSIKDKIWFKKFVKKLCKRMLVNDCENL